MCYRFSHSFYHSLVLVCILLNSNQVLADKPRWHYTLSNDSAIALDDGKTQKFRTVFAPEVAWDIVDDWRFRTQARLLSDPQFDGWSHESSLREFTLDWANDDSRVRLGLQQVVWGQASGFLSSFDVFHPQDQREWLLPAFDFLRRPLWMAQAQQFFGDWMLEALWSPEDKVNRSANQGDIFYLGSKPAPIGQDIIAYKKKRDHQRLALRLSTSFDSLDLAFIYMSVPQNKAIISYEPVSPGQLKQVKRYQRYDILGLSLSQQLNNAILRSELSYYSNIEVQTSSLSGVTQSDKLNFILGMDMTLLTNMDITIEAGQYTFLNYQGNFIERKHTTRAMFQISKTFRHDTLIPRLSMVSDLRQGNLLFRPALQWRVTDQFIVTTGLDIISGNGQPFQALGDTDRGFIQLEFRQ
ncbi:DUF1302 family protein [sulfur-oxidizing endosymbiont of Gigantopelta aegis]|uniref:DUF1302 family protein n=1 Tax=sulfur-oxidizing endosymbiont of Gigantopelta aegis TaxID=2794934 RepID=UPI0018DEAB23|nr:DUF1302 family protein [sulfur-oxidizing endosymbiont of Gigantopelta aegis]